MFGILTIEKMFLILLVAIVLSQCDVGNASPIKSRQVQLVQTLNYRATYRADFQYLLDPSCFGEPPAIRIQCDGANMTILNTSDSSIECSEINDSSIFGTLYACTTDCSDDECEDVYVASNASTFFDGPFGSVTFMCEGDDYRNASASFFYLGQNTTCDSSTVATQTRNYHAGRLGVSCLVGSMREYIFDDTYFECVSYVPPINTQVLGSDDAYTCISGKDCLGEACDVSIDQISFLSYPLIYFDDCVDKTTTATLPSPPSSPITSSFQYTAQFEASWAVLFNPENGAETCTNAHGGAIVSCDNRSVIRYLISSDTSMVCTLINDSELNCIGSDDSITNQFTQVNYVSIFD